MIPFPKEMIFLKIPILLTFLKCILSLVFFFLKPASPQAGKRVFLKLCWPVILENSVISQSAKEILIFNYNYRIVG